MQQIYHVKFRNQRASCWPGGCWCFRTERDHAREQGSKYTVKNKPPRRCSDEELARCIACTRPRSPRRHPRYWGDVTVGEALPKMAKGPMTVTGFIAYAQGWGGLYIRANKQLERSRHSASASRPAGIPDCPGACTGHEFATAVGAPGA